ncbi:MAG: M56 family metallopeptidase [Acidimicrobiales bacterium]
MIGLLAPLAVTYAAAAVVPALARLIRPRHAARLLASTIAALIVASWATATALSLAYLAHHPLAGDRLRWCHDALGVHHPPPTIVGVAAVITSISLTWRMITVAWTWRRSCGTKAHQLHVVDSDRPVAYAEPGRLGGVVITTALLDALTPAERRAVLAHEHAHLRHRHDRHLALAATIDTARPLRPLSECLRNALERWADEDAARSIGNRTTVATAIARAALATTHGPAPALAATGGDVPGRVLALLAPTPTNKRFDHASIAVAAVIGGTTLTQLHHLVAVIETLCHQ